MTKKLALILSALLLSSAILTGCASDGGTTSNDGAVTTEGGAAAETTAETADPYDHDVGSYDFGGDEFHMYTRLALSIQGEMNITEETGDVLNDAQYNRNRMLEERYNFVFAESSMDYSTEVARTAVLAGDNTYDIITTRCVHGYTYAQEGIVLPITDVPVIDLDKPYWDANLGEAMTVLDKQYFAVGAYNLSAYDFTHIMLFNKQMAENFNIGDLYSTVRDGNWTYDTYHNACKTVVADVDGDGQMTMSDRYGILAVAKQILPTFWIAADVLSVEKDSDDKPTFILGSNEKFQNVFSKIFEMHWDDGIWQVNSALKGEVHQDHINMFSDNLALFMDCSFFHVNSMRSMEADFGIIPYPKYDDTQENYMARIEGCELLCVPVTNDTLEMTGVILETMSSESAKTVIPAYYDIALQTKIARDDDSVEMLDLIFANRVFDWGDTIWCDQVRDGIFMKMFEANDRDLASKIASLESTVGALIDKTVETFEKLD